MQINDKNFTDALINKSMVSILGKRTFKEAFGYDNDYEVVQNQNKNNAKIIKGVNWVDSYSENLKKL